MPGTVLSAWDAAANKADNELCSRRLAYYQREQRLTRQQNKCQLYGFQKAVHAVENRASRPE